MRGLTEEETQVVEKMARLDVAYWEWSYWARAAAAKGRMPMGLDHVVLPYREDPGMPLLRKEWNAIYRHALTERAADFGMRIEKEGNRFYLVCDEAEEENLSLSDCNIEIPV